MCWLIGRVPFGLREAWVDVCRGTTVRDAARKIMGDVPIAYIEGVGGVRVAETDVVEVGKNDVSFTWVLLEKGGLIVWCRYCRSR